MWDGQISLGTKNYFHKEKKHTFFQEEVLCGRVDETIRIGTTFFVLRKSKSTTHRNEEMSKYLQVPLQKLAQFLIFFFCFGSVGFCIRSFRIRLSDDRGPGDLPCCSVRDDRSSAVEIRPLTVRTKFVIDTF